MLNRDLEHLKKIDADLVLLAKNIKLLSALTWPPDLYPVFIDSWNRKRPKLPIVVYPKFDYKELTDRLKKLAQDCDADHPIGKYLRQTALSYYVAARMLENIGTPVFRELSEALYGSPKEKLGRASNLDFANDFISITGDFAATLEPEENAYCIRPEVVAEDMQKAADAMFFDHKVQIVVDPALSSKAAAGAERVRLRGATGFSKAEVMQLIQHELYVHTASALNGRSQPMFKSFGLGAPRTTCTQEGIATFAELITATMDLSRLRRIALRIKAIDVAYEGGDFIDVFRFFLESGQSQKESYQSASRIFRGALVSGHHVFTKDVVYLKGLFSVHTFLRKAIEQRKIHYPEYLFIGRVTVGDILSLEPMIEEGVIQRPKYMPAWIENKEGLAAYLSYAAFANRLRLNNVKLEDFITDLDLDQVS